MIDLSDAAPLTHGQIKMDLPTGAHILHWEKYYDVDAQEYFYTVSYFPKEALVVANFRSDGKLKGARHD